MPFPRKFKKILETELKDVESPDYIWLAYAVCALEKQSCGWGGWIIEAAFKKSKEQHATSTGDKLLNVVEQVCPQCGKQLFNTAASIKYEPSKDQTEPLVEGVDYEVLPMEYED